MAQLTLESLQEMVGHEFEAMTMRVLTVDAKVDRLRDDMNRRFDLVDNRFDEMRAEFNELRAEVGGQFSELRTEFNELKDMLRRSKRRKR